MDDNNPQSLDTLVPTLKLMRAQFDAVQPDDDYYHQRYARIAAYAITYYAPQLGAAFSRRLLADYFTLRIERPSQTHTAILRAALALQRATADFHFVPFLRMWDLANLVEADYITNIDSQGGAVSSLAMQVAYAYVTAVAQRPAETLTPDEVRSLQPIIQSHGLRVVSFVVTQIRSNPRHQGAGIAALVAADGFEMNVPTTLLVPNSAITTSPAPHQVRVGQLYDCVLRFRPDTKTTAAAAAAPHTPTDTRNFQCCYGYISQRSLAETFETAVGYVQHIDQGHGHIHIYDHASRHFVARHTDVAYAVGDYVVFAPVIPAINKFKSAFPREILSPEDGPSAFGLRRILIVSVDTTRKCARWKLTDLAAPIVEAGTSTPAFVEGVLWLDQLDKPVHGLPTVGAVYEAVIFLKRAKDGRKYPYLASLTPHKSVSSQEG